MGNAVIRLRRWLDLRTDHDRRLREQWVADWAAELPAQSVILDAGAGDAHLEPLFHPHHYIAADIRPKLGSVPAARPFVCADLHHVPLAAASIDHAVSVQVLEHVRDPARVLAELARVVRVGGTICLSVPQADPEHEQPFDFFRFTTFSLQMLASSAGLEVLELRKKGGYFARLGAQTRDLPFVVLPENHLYRFPIAALVFRAVLVVIFTFLMPRLLIPLDHFDQRRTYTNGYFCVLRKPGPCQRQRA